MKMEGNIWWKHQLWNSVVASLQKKGLPKTLQKASTPSQQKRATGGPGRVGP
jgi:hypothetical protein